MAAIALQLRQSRWRSRSRDPLHRHGAHIQPDGEKDDLEQHRHPRAIAAPPARWSGFARKTAEMVSDFAGVVHNLALDIRDSYGPELHYMRGPRSEIARLMAVRMSYEDPIRIAQLKLAELTDRPGAAGSVDIRKFSLDELIGALPAVIAECILDPLDWVGWTRRMRVSIRFSTKSRYGIRRLKIEAELRRWRLPPFGGPRQICSTSWEVICRPRNRSPASRKSSRS